MKELSKLEQLLVDTDIRKLYPEAQKFIRASDGVRCVIIPKPLPITTNHIFFVTPPMDKINIDLHPVNHWLISAAGYNPELKIAVFTIKDKT